MRIWRVTTSLSAVAILSLTLLAGQTGAQTIHWQGGGADISNPAEWKGHLPTFRDTVGIESTSQAHLAGNFLVGELNVAENKYSNASLSIDGGELLAINDVRVAEYGGGYGKLILNSGNITTPELFVGAANLGNGKDRACSAECEVRGGSIYTRHLTIGSGAGSNAKLKIVGSKASMFAVLDHVWMGVRDAGFGGSNIEMEYQIDAQGVTPISLRNKKKSFPLVDGGCLSTCRLNVSLLDVPPTDDLPLIQSDKPLRGTFTGLPEGSRIRADFHDVTYEWILTYKGGATRGNVVLTKVHILQPDGAEKPHTTGKPARGYLLRSDDVQAAMVQLQSRIDKALPPLGSGTPAFPGAEGFGAYARGGRGGKVIFVTTLNDSGPGSLREAIMTKGPRTILFHVGGAIRLKSSLVITEPFVTIAGQAAPGEGVCIQADTDMHEDALVLRNTHDVILRYVRVQQGVGAGKTFHDDGGDCISVYDSQNFIIDHCSTHFGTDETLSVTRMSDRYTVQWSIIADGLNYVGHSMGSILGGQRCTWHHNLFAHNRTRNPRFANWVNCDFRNNVIYDWGDAAGYGEFGRLNYVANYLRPGPSTTQKNPRFILDDQVALPGSLYLSDNVLEGHAPIVQDNWKGVGFDLDAQVDKPHPMPPVTTVNAEAALDHVIIGVGALLPKRDLTDGRTLYELQKGTGKIINTQQDAGGWQEYPSATFPAEADRNNNGIPDAWETAHGMSLDDPNAANQLNADGYTRLEEYLNELAARRG